MTSHIDSFFEYLRFPSVSTDGAYRQDVENCADWLVARFDKMGLTSEKHPTPGFPVVIARSEKKDDRPTVLIYGHYDVQPVDPESEWDTPPFEPTIRDGRVYCRGATDNKGQNFAHILGVEEELRENGELPVNVIFLIEGEEEIGSKHLPAFLEQNRDLLAADICAVSDTGMIAPGVATMTYGLRGIACLEFTVSGPALDLHSGIYGGSIANPGQIVANLVASMHDENRRVAIPGFYDRVVELESWERDMWKQLPDGDAATLAETGSPGLRGEAGYTSLERRWARPTAEVNGIGGGYQGEGSKTVIPREAMAKISFRLVPDQDPEEILELATRFFKDQIGEDCRIEIEPGHHGPAYVMDAHSPFGKAAQRALEATFQGSPKLIREGGSIPIIQSIKDTLDIDTLMLGLALPDAQVHAPNENFPLENLEAGITLNRNLLKELAG